MRATSCALVLLALAACSGETTVDGTGGGASASSGAGGAATSGAGGACPGSPVLCADACGSDYFPAEADCIGGEWVCPPGTVDPADCPPGTCWGPPLACEVCGPSGWECALEPACVAGCGGLVCAVCPPDGGTGVVGACMCTCDAAGQTTCSPVPGCCEVDLDCGDFDYTPCVNNVCKTTVDGKCWSDAECPPGTVCAGASVCPCGSECEAEDQPGDCVAPP